MNADTVQFEKYWRERIASEIRAHNEQTHEIHGKNVMCPRCDIDAILTVVANKVAAGDIVVTIECFACDLLFNWEDYGDHCPRCTFDNHYAK